MICYKYNRFKKDARSEEHTSELQSPVAISYAVFCLAGRFFTTKPPGKGFLDSGNTFITCIWQEVSSDEFVSYSLSINWKSQYSS